LGILHNGKGVVAGDGQVTWGQTQIKANARKVRTMYHGEVLAGFAGGAADAFALFEKFEQFLEAMRGKLDKAAISMAKEWRTDRMLRRLEAQMIVLNKEKIFLLSGTGDVIEPDDGVVAIGSGGVYALAAARALVAHTSLSAREVVEEALEIAARICIYTNREIEIEEL
jgi:ATP-dependent HslUV protease subunit HslV